MKLRPTLPAAALGLAFLTSVGHALPSARPLVRAQARAVAAAPAQHVLLISVDGLHASDLLSYIQANPASTLAFLAGRGVIFPSANTTRPSDSFPGLMALLTGGSPKTEGVYYDVGYDRADLPPTNQHFLDGTDPTSGGVYDYLGSGLGYPAGLNTPGTEAAYDEFIDADFRRLDGGGGLDPTRVPRDPNTQNPVTPNNFGRDNTIFQVAHQAGLPTAWSDKHVAAYRIVDGPTASGPGTNEYYSPEIAAYVAVVPDPANGNSPLLDSRGLLQVVDPSNAPPATANDANFLAGKSNGTSSIVNVEGYDDLKVRALLNEIDGKAHDGTAKFSDGSAATVPAIFGMNFQAISVGEKLTKEPSPVAGAAGDGFVGMTGGYTGPGGTPGPLLSNGLGYIDNRLGKFVAELTSQGLLANTTIIITAKHGQSPINISTLRMLAGGTTKSPNGPVMQSPGGDLGAAVAHTIEDDNSLLWLKPDTQTSNAASPAAVSAAVSKLNADRNLDAIQTIVSGPLLAFTFGNPATDPRTPDIFSLPDPGVIYSGSSKKVAEHGGFTQDDTNVALLISGAGVTAQNTLNPQSVQTTQVAPTILKLLGLNTASLTAVQKENTKTLPGF